MGNLFDNTISIEVKEEIRIYNAAFVEEKFLALQLDSNNRFDVLVEKTIQEQNYITNLEESIKYIDNKYKQLELELVVQKEIENQKKLLEEKAKQELLKKQEQEKQRLLLIQQREKENKRMLSEEEKKRKELEEEQQRKGINEIFIILPIVWIFFGLIFTVILLSFL
jgi:Fe2+ transport system protein B